MNSLYRALLHLYPADFRREYGEEMARDFARSEGRWALLMEVPFSAACERWDGWRRDWRHTLRALGRAPGFTSAAVVAIALGIGAATSMFSIVDAVLLRPLPYQKPEQLMTVLREGNFALAPAHYFGIRDEQRLMAEFGAAEVWGVRWSLADHNEMAPAMRVTANMFRLLGVPPLYGRTPAQDEWRSVVLSHRLWGTRFGGDPRVVGQAIVLNEETYTIVGVMPPRFEFSPFWAKADLWGVLDLEPRRGSYAHSLRFFGRVREGVSFEQAREEIARLDARLKQADPERNRGISLRLTPLTEKVVGPVKPLLWTLSGAVALVLLVACANVANLLLARAMARRREMAIRAAIGASGGQLIQQLLMESLAITAAGGLLGCASAAALIRAIRLMPGDVPYLDTIQLDARVAMFAVAACVVSGVLFGVTPAWLVAREDVRDSLAGGRGATARARRWRGVLVSAEVAMSLVLLVGAGLLVRSFVRLTETDAGFDPRGVAALTVSMSKTQRAGTVIPQLVEQIRRVPGVRSASAANHPPVVGDIWGFGYTIESQPRDARDAVPTAVYRVVEPGYFATMGMRLREGRGFTDHDQATAPPVVIINETFARRHFPRGALGERIRFHDEKWRTVVGVLRDGKQSKWTEAPDAEFFLPLQQDEGYREGTRALFSQFTLVMRLRDPGVLSAVQQEIARYDRRLSRGQPEMLEQAIDELWWRPRMAMATVTGFGAVTLLLAALGIYGVIAYTTSLRTKELSIRLALGATPGQVQRQVLSGGLRLVLAGIGCGVVMAWPSTRLIESLLYGVDARDAVSFAAAPLIFIAVGIAAAMAPARRAAKLDPATVLRQE